MHFKASPFNHPQYTVLRSQSESLAKVWLTGHIIAAIALAMAAGFLLSYGIVFLILPDLGPRIFSAGAASMVLAAAWAAAGLGLKLFARRRSRRLNIPK